MRLTQADKAKNRERILETAGRLFRERGIDHVAIADVMGAAGFTHGGFYNHFRSKEALAAEVCELNLSCGNAKFAAAIEQAAVGVESVALCRTRPRRCRGRSTRATRST